VTCWIEIFKNIVIRGKEYFINPNCSDRLFGPTITLFNGYLELNRELKELGRKADYSTDLVSKLRRTGL
jgi:hypothetical protein